MSALREKLRGAVMATGWDALAGHHQRQALFVVHPAQDLLAVAIAVAEDRADEIGGWLAAGVIGRPRDEDVSEWEGSPTTRFQFVIVQPFVLAQRLPD